MDKINQRIVVILGILSFAGLIGLGYGLAQAEKPDWVAQGNQIRQSAPVCPPESDGIRYHARVVTDKGRKTIVSPTPVGYGPTQFRTAYSLTDSASSNPLPIIAIVDAYDQPNIQKDLNKYSSTMNMPSLPACSGPVKNSAIPCFQKINQNGGMTSFPRTNSAWALEISLDVEVAHVVCQNCRLLLVEAASNSYGDLLTAIDTAVNSGANVVSGSWSSVEFSGEPTLDFHFDKPGVAFTFSSGDSGFCTAYPAASRFVTSIGGTTLNLNTDNSYGSETVWAGTGSGCSLYESKPSWQKDSLCKNRTMNDAAADADPNTGAAVYDSVSYFGVIGWFQVGGTSLATPIIGAVYAMGGVPSSTQANSLPYTQGTSSNLHDIANGSDGICGNYLCLAEVGYDGPTGLGTPKGTGAF